MLALRVPVIACLACFASACVTVHDPIAADGAGGSSGKEPVSGGATGSGGAGEAGGALIAVDAGRSGAGSTASGGQGSGVAPQCRSSGECSLPTPYCQLPEGVCVQCETANNCAGGTGRYCNTVTHMCVACLSDLQCGTTEPYCSPDGECVQCRTTLNCGDKSVVCDPTTYRCVATCGSDADCSATLGRPYCDMHRSLCVECLADDECPPVTPRCDLTTGVCGQCAVDADCSGLTPRCDPGRHVCVGCLTSSDCDPGTTCIKSSCVAPTM
jgi:hypothetical protein